MKVETIRWLRKIAFSDVRITLEDLRELVVRRRGDARDRQRGRGRDGDGLYFQRKKGNRRLVLVRILSSQRRLRNRTGP